MTEYKLHSILHGHSEKSDGQKFESANNKNRFRSWDEFRYSVRSVFKHTQSNFRNKIQILVHNKLLSNGSISISEPFQLPSWFQTTKPISQEVEILSHDDFFTERARKCAPTFNSATVESQVYNTGSQVDYVSVKSQ